MPTDTAAISRALLRIAQAARRQVRSDNLGLTPAQSQTVLFCGRTRPDFASIGHLSQALGATHATAVGIVDGLVRRGLIERRAKLDDRRVTLLTLTNSGQQVFAALTESSNILDQAIERLEPAQRDALLDAVRSLGRMLAHEGAIQVSEPCAGCTHFFPHEQPSQDRPHFCRSLRQHLNAIEILLECPRFTPETTSVSSRS